MRHAVHKPSSGFGRFTRETATKVAGGVEDKGTGSGQCVGLQSEKGRQSDDCCAGDLVDIGLDTCRLAAEIELRVSVVAIVRLGRRAND